MSVKITTALILLGLLIFLVLENQGSISIHLGFGTFSAPKPFFLFGVFASGVISGLLLRK